jgi:peptidoglycan/LPS O-acetylase OafA/YrhL
MPAIAYRPEIDGLRAIAVLAVVLYHAGTGIANQGFAGVDVFFVISGYLITALLHREWQSSGRIDLIAFYARRVRRILPAMVVVIAVTLVLSAFLLSPLREQRHVAQSGAASLLMTANVFFQFTSGGYFDGSSDEMPLLHLWSLSVEEQFYLLWPLLLLAILRLRPKYVLPAVATALILSFVLAELLIAGTPSAAFYQMPARFWELALGGMVALRAPAALRPGIAMAAAYAGATTVLAAMIVVTFPGHFPGIGALPATLGAALLLLAVHGSRDLGLVGAWLRSPPMRSIGLISYSLYLWHWPLLALDKATRIGPQPVAVAMALCLLAVLLAWLSYRFVETPFRRARSASHRVIATGLTASVMLGASAAVFAHYSDAGDNLNALAVQAIHDMPANMARCHYGEDAPVDDLPRAHCSSTAATPSIVIWGDSYALAWQPFAYAIAQHQRLSAIGFSRDSCRPILQMPGDTPRAASCRAFNRRVADYITSRRIDTLILAGMWQPSMQQGLRNTIAAVAPHVGRILVIGPTPVMRESAPICIQSGRVARCGRMRGEFEASAKPLRRMLAALPVEVVDATDFFCDASRCPVLKQGRSLYWDDDHVASSAARDFAAVYLRAHRWPPVTASSRVSPSREDGTLAPIASALDPQQ